MTGLNRVAHSRCPGTWLFAALLACTLWAPSLSAQDSSQDSLAAEVAAEEALAAADFDVPSNYTQVQHIIRPGDTFISVTTEFLGNEKLWPLNSRLNPDQRIRKLPPGARMKVLIDPARVPIAARVARRSGTVEAQPSPMSWIGAQPDDLLIEKDAARTRRNSSAELEFHDGTSVVITEDSLVFIRKLGRGLSTEPANRTTQQVELVTGQADLSSLAGSNTGRDDVEILMGGSTLKLPKESPIRTRTAHADSGTSRVGIYEGDAEFDSGSGEPLQLASGEGLVAKANEAPKKERLLDAPTLDHPAADAELVAGELPRARWSSPEGETASYTFEVCRDMKCGNLVHRTVGTTSLSEQLPDLGPGTYYWRTTAASSSGLDGYPSSARQFTVVAVPSDAIAPVVALALRKFGVPYQGQQAYGPHPPLETSMSDEGTGIEHAGFVIGGREFGLDEPLPTGAASVALFAVDGAQQRSQSDPIELFIDADAPSLTVATRTAPSFSRRTVQRPKRKRALLRAKAKGATYPPNPVFALSPAEPIGFSIDDVEWRPLATSHTGLLTNSNSLHLAVNTGFCLQAEDGSAEASAGNVCGRSFLTINASDEHTGVKVLKAQLTDERLLIEASDEVGNSTSLSFRITRE